MVFLQQLYIMLWKDIYLSRLRRHYLISLLDIATVIIAFSVAVQYAIKPQPFKPVGDSTYETVEPLSYWWKNENGPKDLQLVTSSAEGTMSYDLIQSAAEQLNITQPIAVVPNEAEMLKRLLEINQTHTGLGILMETSPYAHPNVSMLTTISFVAFNQNFDVFVEFKRSALHPSIDDIFDKPEITLAMPIAYVILRGYAERFKRALNSTAQIYDLFLNRLPFPKHIRDETPEENFAKLVYFTAATQIMPFLMIILCLSTDRVTGIREMLQMTGLQRRVYWVGQVSSCVFMNIFKITIQMIMLTTLRDSRGYAVIQGSDPLLLFFVLSIAYIALMSHAMLLSVCFEKSGTSVIIGLFYFILTLIFPYCMLETPDGVGYFMLSSTSKVFSSILPIMNIHWTWRHYERYEKFCRGVRWGDLFGGDQTPTDIPLIVYIAINIINIVISLLLTWYLDQVLKSGPGLTRPLNFVCSGQWNRPPVRVPVVAAKPPEHLKNNFEDDPLNAVPVVTIFNACKNYGDLVALDKVSYSLFENQITVLLGQNGAGKTTLLGITTGFLEATAGTVLIDGYNLVENPESARASVGFCPQDNILFDDLTVEEHLLLFAVLREENRDKIKHEVVSLILDVGLKDYRYDLVASLSLSMQRRLSAALALLMHPKIVILDEPTQFMDPDGRKELWEVLLKARKSSSVFITTQNMDEAEVLGDRVAILVDGVIVCSGSTQFLKKKFGAGYTLKFKKTPNINVMGIEEVVKKHAINAYRSDEGVADITFVIGQVLSRQMVTLFKDLEKKQAKLNYTTVRVLVNTLNDVLVHVGADQQKHDLSVPAGQQGADCGHRAEAEKRDSLVSEMFEVSKSASSFGRIFGALIQKRMADCLQNYGAVFQTWLLPLIAYLCMTKLTEIVKTTSRLSTVDLQRPAGHPFAVDTTPIKLKSSKDNVYYKIAPGWKDEEFVQKHIQNILSSQQVNIYKIESDKNINEFILNRAHTYLQNFLLDDYMALEFINNSIIVYFNDDNPFAPLAGVALMTTAILQKFGVTVQQVIRPIVESPDAMNRTKGTTNLHSFEKDAIIQVRAIFFPLLATLMVYHFADFLIAERTLGVKHIQTMSGVSGLLYWLSNFMFDFAIYTVAGILLSVAFLSKQEEYHWAITALIFCHGISAIPFVYIYSFVLQQAGLGASNVTFLLFIGGSVGVILEEYIGAGIFFNLKLDYVFSFLPSFAFHEGARIILMLVGDNNICLSTNAEQLTGECDSLANQKSARTVSLQKCCEAFRNDSDRKSVIHEPLSFDHPETGWLIVVSLLLQGIVSILLLVLLESQFMFRLIQSLFYGEPPTSRKQQANQADVGFGSQGKRNLLKDIQTEEKNAEEAALNYQKNINTFGKGITIHKMTKVYTAEAAPIRAIDDLSLNVLFGNCLGFLGVNGSGKSTTFKCVTGDVYPAYGNAFRNVYSLMNEYHEFRSSVGYIPQKDGLLYTLTGLEQLEFYCVLRNIAPESVPRMIRILALIFRLEDALHMPVSAYSNGTRRRLSMAIAFLGLPDVVLMDEPYVGMDNISHYHIAQFIKAIQVRRKISMMFATHFLHDVEQLCMRIAILSAGRLICIGVLDDLKAEFGQGYTIVVKTYPDKKHDNLHHEDIINAVKESFKGAELLHNFEGLLDFRMPNADLKWSQCFINVNKIRKKIKVQDLFVSDTTMEQIFMTINRKAEADYAASPPR